MQWMGARCRVGPCSSCQCCPPCQSSSASLRELQHIPAGAPPHPCGSSSASLRDLQHIPASPDCTVVASAAGPHVLPGQEGGGEGPCGHPGWAGLGAGPSLGTLLLWGSAEVLHCREGPGCSPWILWMQRWGVWVPSVGRGSVCLCVCTLMCAYLLPPSRGATAVVPPCTAPTSLPGATCSYLLLQVLNIHISLSFFPLFFYFPSPFGSAQLQTACNVKPGAFYRHQIELPVRCTNCIKRLWVWELQRGPRSPPAKALPGEGGGQQPQPPMAVQHSHRAAPERTAVLEVAA